MKKLLVILVLASFVYGCQENDSPKKSDYTGNESVYSLQAGSAYPIDGTATFKEKIDGTAVVGISIKGTEGDVYHPVHLHLGNISKEGASVVALLNPVLGKTGTSETHLTILADESKITYKDLIKLNACIKVHLSDSGPEKDIVLAGGNVGAAAINDSGNGRVGIAVCKSE